MSDSEVSEIFGYREARHCRRDAAAGRELWRALNAWPWAALPEGRLRSGWEESEGVTIGWDLWRADREVEHAPVAGWLDPSALAPGND